MQGQCVPIRVGRSSINTALGTRQAGFDCCAISGVTFPDSSHRDLLSHRPSVNYQTYKSMRTISGEDCKAWDLR
jgi:hypothetical protein